MKIIDCLQSLKERAADVTLIEPLVDYTLKDLDKHYNSEKPLPKDVIYCCVISCIMKDITQLNISSEQLILGVCRFAEYLIDKHTNL